MQPNMAALPTVSQGEEGGADLSQGAVPPLNSGHPLEPPLLVTTLDLHQL